MNFCGSFERRFDHDCGEDKFIFVLMVCCIVLYNVLCMLNSNKASSSWQRYIELLLLFILCFLFVIPIAHGNLFFSSLLCFGTL